MRGIIMNKRVRDYINELADAVIAIYKIEIPISNIDKVVNEMGGTIITTFDFDELCDGTIKKDGNFFKIMLSVNQSDNRRTFTIAHELGHLFLHMGYRTNSEVWKHQSEQVYSRFGTSEQEYQANEFAAALLMPKKEYKQYIQRIASGDKVNMQEVADHFHVSKLAAINRGRFLGLIRN